jgi:hypothetical protein
MMAAFRNFVVWLLVVSLEAVCILAPGHAVGQVATTGFSGLAVINKMIQSATLSNGSAAAQAIEAVKVASGATVPVVETATVGLTAARIGVVLGRVAVGATGVGLATIILPWAWNKSGLKVCPPPNFICKPDPSNDQFFPSYFNVGGSVTQFPDPLTAAQWRANKTCQENGASVGSPYCPVVNSCPTVDKTVYTINCPVASGGTGSIAVTRVVVTSTCPAGYHAVNGQYCTADVGKLIPATQGEVADAISTGVGSDQAMAKQLYDKTKELNPSVNFFYPGDPVTITAPPVVSDPVVKTTQIQNPDGSTSTKTERIITTVTPKQVGDNLGNVTMSYPATTTTTTTIVNNVSNASNTYNDTITETVPSPPPQAQQQPQPDMCQSHPELTVCQNSTAASNCAAAVAAVTCTGDAIQCATLQAAKSMECRQADDIAQLTQMDATKLGQAIGGGNDPLLPSITQAMKGDEVDLSSNRLDSSGFLGGGACFPTRTITLMGKSVTVDFTTPCEKITPLRYVFLTLGTIVGYLIVSRSVIQG